MNKKNLIFAILIIFVTVFSCSEETPIERGYPKVTTVKIKNVSSNGAIFFGEINNFENLDIIEYGFLWNTSSAQSIFSSDKKVVGNNFSGGNFSATINSSLREGIDYKVSAYLKTNNYTVFGNEIEFNSKGSLGATINSLEPNSGVWGDTINIKGKNFSYIKANNKVRFNDKESLIISSTDSVITCVVPPVENSKELSIVVEIANKETVSPINLLINEPQITSISSLTGTYRDELIITGNNFGKKDEYNKFYFGDVLASLEYINRNTLKVIVPDEIKSKTSELKLKSSSFSTVYNESFKLLNPIITNAKTSVITGEKVIIEGKYFHPIKEKNIVTFENVEAEIEIISPSKIEATVPIGPFPKRTAELKIAIIDMAFEFEIDVEIEDKWLLISNNLPFIKSVYHPSNTVVANNTAYIISRKSEIEVTDPNFDKHFLWKFNEPEKTWSSEIIPFKIGYLNWNNLTTNSQNLYLYLPNETNNFMEYNTQTKTWSKKKNFPGHKRSYITSFNINGYIFMGMGIDYDSRYDQRYSDFYQYNPNSDTWKRLNDFKPRTFSANFIINDKAYLLGGAFSTGDTDCYAYNPQNDTWNRKADLNVSFNRNTSFALNNKGYLVAQNKIYIYNPNTNVWNTEAFIEDDYKPRKGNFSFSLNNKGYIGGGEVQNYYNLNMFEFMPN